MLRFPNLHLVKRPLFIFCATAQILAISLFHFYDLIDVMKENLDYRFLFRTRQILDFEPQFHKKLKIFTFDDRVGRSDNALETSLDSWSKLLIAISQKKPKAIYIDKSFDEYDMQTTGALFASTIKSLRVPVYAAATLSDRLIHDREPLALPSDYGLYKKLLADQRSKSFFAYGPPPDIFAAFTAVGHTVYQGSGRILTAARVGEDRYLPHLAFVGEPSLNDIAIPSGKFWVNFAGLKNYAPQPINVAAVISSSHSKTFIEPDDVILIVPAASEEISAWQPGPLGIVPRSYVVASILNSRITGRYLHEPNIGLLLLMGGFSIGTIYGLVLSPLWFFVALILTTNLYRIVAISSFVHSSVLIPSSGPAAVLAIQGVFAFVYKMMIQKRAQILAKAELDLARTVQRKFLPQESYLSSELDIFGFFKPANECSGDWWSHLHIDDTRHIVLVGDVTGHGVPSALLAASMNASSELLTQLHRKRALASLSASEILSHLNSSVCGVIKSELYCSVSLIDVDLKRGKLAYANAGHIPPLVVRRHESVGPQEVLERIVSLRTLNNPLGVNPDEKFTMDSLDLLPGDKIILYTDGLTEWFSRRGGRLTPSALRKELSRLGQSEAKDIPGSLAQRAEALSERSIQPDDITIVVLDYKGLESRI